MINKEQYNLVSIIVPCYNYGTFLTECLESVRLQSYTNWECIVIDNGSTDNTKQVAETFIKGDQRFKYYYTEQSGVSFARNYGVEKSGGVYILPLDADDKIEASYIEKAVRYIDNNNKVKLVYCDAFLFGASSGRWILPPYNFKNLLIENSIFCSALFRKSDFQKTKGYNEEMKEGFEDWDFWISMLKSGGEVYKIQEPLFYYRIRSSSRNNSLDAEKQLRLRKKLFENHREIYEQMFPLAELIFEKYTLQNQIKTITCSREFKFGRAFLKPFRFLKNLINK